MIPPDFAARVAARRHARAEAVADLTAQIEALAATRRVFSRRNIKRPPGINDNQVGKVFLDLKRRGVIERVGSTVTGHAAGHQRSIALWAGALDRERRT